MVNILNNVEDIFLDQIDLLVELQKFLNDL